MNRRREQAEKTDLEIARLIVGLNSLAASVVISSSAHSLMSRFKIKLHEITVYPILREYRKQLEGKMQMAGETSKRKKKGEALKVATAKPTVKQVGAQLVLEKAARVVSKTYAFKGDDEKVASEDALKMLVQLFNQYDSSLLTRNERRALPHS